MNTTNGKQNKMFEQLPEALVAFRLHVNQERSCSCHQSARCNISTENSFDFDRKCVSFVKVNLNICQDSGSIKNFFIGCKRSQEIFARFSAENYGSAGLTDAHQH